MLLIRTCRLAVGYGFILPYFAAKRLWKNLVGTQSVMGSGHTPTVRVRRSGVSEQQSSRLRDGPESPVLLGYQQRTRPLACHSCGIALALTALCANTMHRHAGIQIRMLRLYCGIADFAAADHHCASPSEVHMEDLRPDGV
jgi:hypothetical protein